MENPLLPQATRTATCDPYVGELKRVTSIALPMIIATVGQYLLRVSPIFMLGHLGELQLSSVSIATSFSNVTGFSVLFGMSSALETLCGQAFGAKQYQRLGAYTYGAIACLFIVCVPISLLWIFTDKLLIFTGQAILLCRSPVNGSIPAGTEFNPSNTPEHSCRSIHPAASLLGFGIQA